MQPGAALVEHEHRLHEMVVRQQLRLAGEARALSLSIRGLSDGTPSRKPKIPKNILRGFCHDTYSGAWHATHLRTTALTLHDVNRTSEAEAAAKSHGMMQGAAVTIQSRGTHLVAEGVGQQELRQGPDRGAVVHERAQEMVEQLPPPLHEVLAQPKQASPSCSRSNAGVNQHSPTLADAGNNHTVRLCSDSFLGEAVVPSLLSRPSCSELHSITVGGMQDMQKGQSGHPRQQRGEQREGLAAHELVRVPAGRRPI